MLILARFVTGVSAGFMAPAGLSIITTSFAEGASAQPRAAHLRGRSPPAGFSLGHGRRRPADRDRLALGVLRARRDGGGAARRACGSSRATSARRARGAASTSPARCCVTGAMLAARLRRRPGAGRRAGRRRWPRWPPSGALLAAFVVVERRARGAARAARASCARGPLVRANVGAHAVHRLLRRLPVRRRALPAGAARLVVGRDRARAAGRRASTRSSRRRSRRGWSSASATLPRRSSPAWRSPRSATRCSCRSGRTGRTWRCCRRWCSLGLAFALAYGPLTIVATDGVDEHEQGLASGLLNVSFQFGAAIGLAVVSRGQRRRRERRRVAAGARSTATGPR